MESIWEMSARSAPAARLDRDIRTDVLIIGGGLCGVLCAYLLAQAGVDYVLAEAEVVCGGVTKNTTAKITSQHALIYDKLIRQFGVEKAKQYLDANEAALRRYRALCEKLDCDFETRDAYVYSRDRRDKIERELAALQRLGFPAEFAGELPLPFPVAGAVRFRNQAQFNPLKFVAAITPGLRIYEHTAVRALEGTTAITDRGRIAAKRVIVTTHFPFLNRHGAYFLKLYQHRSYVIALENAPDVGGMYVDEAQKGLSFRNYRGLLLLGGGGHRTGRRGGGWQELRGFAAQNYPDARERAHWATQDCMSLDGAPYIGAYAAGAPGLYVATGFNKWGMTSSLAAAEILCDLMLSRVSPYAGVFAPARSLLRPQLAANALEAAVSLLTPTARRCPHMGCALHWNKAEHSWDCPCHGSRFTGDGQLLDNPATGDLRK